MSELFGLYTLISMTTPQTAVVVVLAVLLGGMVIADFVLLYLFSKERHRRHQRARDSLSKQIAMHATIHEQDTLALRKQIEELTAASMSTPGSAIGGGEQHDALEEGKGKHAIYLDEADEDSTLSYKKSFEARLIQSSDSTKNWYTDMKNELLSFNKITDAVSWKWESFRYKRRSVVKMVFRGKTLCVYFALDPQKYDDKKLAVEDVSNVNSMADTPTMIRIKNDKRLKQALMLIGDLMTELGAEKGEREEEDFYQARVGTVSLIKQGLIKRVVRPSKKSRKKGKAEADAEQDVAATTTEETPSASSGGSTAESAATGAEAPTAPTDNPESPKD